VTSIRIAAAVIDAIVDHARREAPNECCGLLVGSVGAIERAVPTRNAASSPTRYLVDPSEHFALIRELRGTGSDIAGAYHSHPGSPAIPSPSDIAEAWPEFLYVIVSLEDEARPDVRAFRIADGNYIPVGVTTDRL
jgi:proteasome lid subunit RPN8/RPN11